MVIREAFEEGKLIPGTAYRVRGLIGRGGMGAVYEVEHAELGRTFVLKVLHGHLTSRADLVARMRNEWRALAKLNHPHIVQVTDAGQTQGGVPYFVMEHLLGQPLSTLLASEGRLGLRRACALVVDVLEGLSAAHATGAIHRDIKPPNIFVTESNRAKLLDFGIAKLRDRVAKVVTAGGVSIGTPRFMAPEQAEGGKVDGRADIYAAGLVLFECLVGKGPFFDIKDPNQLVMAHIGMEPPRADHLEARVPEELGDLIQRWLSKSPASRPQTAAHAAQELAALAKALADEPELSQSGEATIHAAYESPTVGAPLSTPLSDRAAENRREPDKLEPSPVARGDGRPTITCSSVSGSPSSVPVGGGGFNPQRTVAWGTPATRLSTESPASRGPKGSETPSPVSASSVPPPSATPSGPSLVRLTAAACVVAFTVAGAVTLVGKQPGAEQVDPAPPPSVPAAPPPASPSMGPNEENSVSDSMEQVEVFDVKPPQPSTPALKQPAPVQRASVARKASPAPIASPVAATSPVLPDRPATAPDFDAHPAQVPERKTAASPVASPPALKRADLPGSGLE